MSTADEIRACANAVSRHDVLTAARLNAAAVTVAQLERRNVELSKAAAARTIERVTAKPTSADVLPWRRPGPLGRMHSNDPTPPAAA
ncbi:conserved protein of unknown function (plasmid) [Rhodovastum atsumiense]|uniref:Uncharacterized protein n=1 Tax=Rhodovastum atsumiense TaxID=504468 RepID=A0A5M6IN56_9PROT|nr:hypothetical protein [Rhodovastum atsumiense]KAA5609693.1 hypothetical protein F1189_23320 [Rhodovastum atsumiense]CAH2606473.1 conserved protein of unknown function [Rhodovastum atsumiense]